MSRFPKLNSKLCLMPKVTPETEDGFDMAVLTHKRIDEATIAGTSPIYESDENQWLFLLSSSEANVTHNTNNVETIPRSKKLKRTVNRKRVTDKDSITHHDKTYQINNGKGRRKFGLFTGIVQRIIEQFEIARIKWKRVFVLRFDLHLPTEFNHNKQMTLFRKRLFQKLKREYGFKQT